MVTVGFFGQMLSSCGELDSVYDNSRPFETFLTQNGLDDVLGRHKLVRRKRHTIVPHVSKPTSTQLTAHAVRLINDFLAVMYSVGREAICSSHV